MSKYKQLHSILIFLLANGFWKVQAQSLTQLIYDQKQSAVMGAQNLTMVHQVLYSFQDKHIRDTLFIENTLLKKSTGIGYRIAKLMLLDQPIDQFISLTQHEVFGHGFRYREFEYEKIFYNLNLSYPYGKGGGYSGAWNGNIAPTLQERNVLNIGGVEANRLLADNITHQVLLDNKIHYRQGLLFYWAQNNLFRYLWTSRTGQRSLNNSNDMNNYVNIINTLYSNNSEKKHNLTTLSNQSFVSLINPMQLYALYAVVYVYGIKGQKSVPQIPMIRISNIRYLPALNYSLTPFGSQYHFVNYFRYNKALIIADIALGDKTVNEFYGVSLKGFNLVNKQKITINAHLDIWNQPALELEKYTKPESANRSGEAVKLDIHYRLYNRPNQLGLFIQLGYKSKGFLLGEMLAETPILRFGLSIHL